MSATGWMILFVALLAAYLAYDHFSVSKTSEEEPSDGRELKPEDRVLPHMTAEESAKETSVRKQWLVSFVIYTVWTLCSALIATAFADQPPVVEGGEEVAAPSPLSMGLWTAAFILGFAWITYHFAYIKRGTAWLTFLLIMFVISQGMMLMFLSSYATPEMKEDLMKPWNLASTVLGALLLIYYWVNCYRLRKVNALRRNRSVS